jgi:hypothetical protein
VKRTFGIHLKCGVQTLSYSSWVLTNEPKCLHQRWYSGDKTMERRWLDWLGMCGVRKLPFYFENWDCWCISHTLQGFLTTRDTDWKPLLCQKCSCLHKTKCCAFQHFHVILPTYFKEEAYCWIHADHADDEHSTK